MRESKLVVHFVEHVYTRDLRVDDDLDFGQDAFDEIIYGLRSIRCTVKNFAIRLRGAAPLSDPAGAAVFRLDAAI